MNEMNPRSSRRDDSLGISLRDLAAPLFRRKRVLITTFLVALTAVFLTGFVAPSKYTSHMAILISRERLDPLVTTEATTQLLGAGNPVTKEEINSEAELLKSRDLLEKIAVASGLDKIQKKSFLDLFSRRWDDADNLARAVKTIASDLKVDTSANSNMIEVTYSSSDPRLSYGVLKALGDLYLEKHVAVHRPPGSYAFFAQETQKYRRALDDSEARLKSFNEQPGAAAPDLVRANMAVQITGSIGQMHSTEQTIAADEQRIRSDREQIEITPQRSATKQDTDAANLLLQNLGGSLLTAETKRTELLLKYDPSYPLVKEADQEVAETKAAIAEAEKTSYINQETDRDPTFELLREDMAKTGADLATQRATLVAVRQSVRSMQKQMADLDQKSVTQQDLRRDVKANEDNYLLYLSKREQERTSDALDKTRIANVAIAVPPGIPVLPSHGFAFALFGLCLATVLSLAMSYTVEYFDSSFHTPAQVTEFLGIPVVVAVPRKAS